MLMPEDGEVDVVHEGGDRGRGQGAGDDARNRKRASLSNGVVKLACGFARRLDG